MRLIQSYAAKKSVLEAARERMAFVFDSFEQIIVSVSGGKDSTVMAHLALCRSGSAWPQDRDSLPRRGGVLPEQYRASRIPDEHVPGEHHTDHGCRWNSD